MFPKLILPFLIASIGFLLTTRKFILFMSNRSPLVGLIIFYTLITIIVSLFQHLGLVINGTEYNDYRHLIGSVLIIFSYFIVTRLESCYMNTVVHGQCDEKHISNIYLQSEDGATYYLWSTIVDDPKKLRFLTYILTPFTLSLIGSLLVTDTVTF